MLLQDLPSSFSREIVAGIDARLGAVEAEHGVSIPLAVESGSRAWGFPSPSRKLVGVVLLDNRTETALEYPVGLVKIQIDDWRDVERESSKTSQSVPDTHARHACGAGDRAIGHAWMALAQDRFKDFWRG
jgi:hypothetical protein